MLTQHDQKHPTVSARFGAEFPWDWRSRDALHALQDELIRALTKPIVPDRTLLFGQHSEAVRNAKLQRQEAFLRDYPAVPLQKLWREICDNKAAIPEIAEMPESFVAAFVDVTAWCYAKEGTGIKGRFSVNRLWRAIDREAEEVETWIKPVGFQTECGACGAPANALSGSAALASTARPTRIECTRCKHVDVVGRAPAYYDPDHNVVHRLRCACATCEAIRADVCARARSEIGPAIDRTASELAAFAQAGVAKNFDEIVSSGADDPSMVLRIERALSEGVDLKQALLSAERYGSEEKRLASAIEDATKAGCLKITDVRPIGTSDDLVAAAMQGIDLGAYDDEHKLASIFEEMMSGSVQRVVKGCKLIEGLHTYLAPVVVDAAWLVESGERAAPTGAASQDSRSWFQEATPAREDPADGLPHPDDPDDLSQAEALLRRAAGLVDQVLGAGAARRCPELVLEMLRSLR